VPGGGFWPSAPLFPGVWPEREVAVRQLKVIDLAPAAAAQLQGERKGGEGVCSWCGTALLPGIARQVGARRRRAAKRDVRSGAHGFSGFQV
jgi:hypothetical protein